MSTRVDAYNEVVNLLTEWVTLSDAGRLDEFAQILEPDCTLAFVGFGELRGRESVLAYMLATGKDAEKIAAGWDAGKGGKHLVVNTTVRVTGSRATAESDILVVSHGHQTWRILM